MMRRSVLNSLRMSLAVAMSAPVAAKALGGYTGTPADQASFARYIEGVKTEALAEGISASVLQAAFATVRLNPRVIELDRSQPEVQFTWARYRSSVVSDRRMTDGRAQYARHAALLQRVAAAYGVPGPIVVGLWGLSPTTAATSAGFR